MNATAKAQIAEAIQSANKLDSRGDTAARDRVIVQVYYMVDAPTSEIDAALTAGGYGYAVPIRLRAISISMDGAWAGSGVLRNGTIENCGAQFCDDNDESLEIYDQIEVAIANGRNSVKVELDGETKTITWSLT